MSVTPDDVADALTGTQAREAVRGFLYAVNRFGETENVREFHSLLIEATTFAHRLSGEVPSGVASTVSATAAPSP